MASRLRDPELAAATRLVAQAGLFEKQPAFYVRKFGQIVALVALCAAALIFFDHLLARLAVAPVLALAFTQLAYIAHDAGHHQVFPQRRHNDWLGLVIVNFCLGLSYGWWVDKHNRHHDHPNDLDHDPDIRFPLMVFDRQQLAAPRSAFQNFVIRHQALLFFPLLTLLTYGMRLDSLQFLRQSPSRQRGLELALLAAHVILFGAAAFGLLGLWDGALFIGVYQAAFGVFLGSAFAANHKGMPILDEAKESSTLWRQVVTTRNLRAHPFTGFWYGGLDCQIEHHLFPMLPRHNLRKATPYIREFCARHGVPYHEAGVVQSYTEILQHLHHVSAPLREEPGKKN
jgi:fatty acid desaturase